MSDSSTLDAIRAQVSAAQPKDGETFVGMLSIKSANQTVIDAARRFPMMSDYQLVVVREAQLMKDIELLSNYAKMPLNSTILTTSFIRRLRVVRQAISASLHR